MLEDLRGLVWSETFWLPKQKVLNLTWDDLVSHEEGVYLPQLEDLHWTFFLGIALLGVRYVYETLIVVPVARKFGVKEKKPVQLTDNPILEDAYRQKPKLDDISKKELSKKSDLPIRQIEVWFRKRAKKHAISDMKKFTECSWHFLFYLGAFIYGLIILWDKPWFAETKVCWQDWPKQTVTNDVYWYYAIELGFYWSLVFTLFTDHKRKDFTEMIVHHVTTMFLMYFSWVLNFVRVGTLVLLVHDASDYWMALAKMAKYCGKESLTDIFFVIFMIFWVISRLVIYPFKVLYCTTIEPFTRIEESFGSHVFFNVLLYILLVLHIVWSFMIGKIVVGRLIGGSVNDVRSDGESSGENEEASDKDAGHNMSNYVNGSLQNNNYNKTANGFPTTSVTAN